jgi:uncharacterized protein (TIGR02117 family)
LAWKVLAWVAAILLGAPLIYAMVAFACAVLTPPLALPASQGAEIQGAGIQGNTIYACDNGVHTDLVLPAVSNGVDWRAVFQPKDFRGPIGQSHVSIGWGSKDFYVNTPTWADLRPMRAIRALLWDETVLHVEYRPQPMPSETCGVWVVGGEDYRRITAFVLSSLGGGPSARPTAVAAGYGPRDAFFRADGQYTIVETCNQWTGRALRAGGAPVAPWAPFSFLVLWRLPPVGP